MSKWSTLIPSSNAKSLHGMGPTNQTKSLETFVININLFKSRPYSSNYFMGDLKINLILIPITIINAWWTWDCFCYLWYNISWVSRVCHLYWLLEKYIRSYYFNSSILSFYLSEQFKSFIMNVVLFVVSLLFMITQ